MEPPAEKIQIFTKNPSLVCTHPHSRKKEEIELLVEGVVGLWVL